MKWISQLILRKAAFVYPVLPAPRTAVLEPWFKSKRFRSKGLRSSGSIQVFDRGWCPEAAAYRPAAIAGTWQRLEPLLSLKMESLTHAVIVLARRGDPLLTFERRQRLWRAFRVPVFEQIIGENGILLAAECEAHAGLHIESPKFDPAGHAIETEKCGCGRTAPRLKASGQSEEIRVTAAYAR